MDVFEKKTLKVARGYTYTYYVSPADDVNDTSDTSPGLLFQHGFPDSAELWQFVAPKLLPLAKKHRIIIPDLLGAGETSKPTHSAAYTFSYMTRDILEILDAENVKTVISIGHDWGSAVAQRVYLHAPERVVGMILFNVAYIPVDYDRNTNIDLMNKASMNAFGYNAWEYWKLLTASDAPALMKAHPEKVWEICHGDEEDWMKQMFCVDGNMRKYLEDENWKVKKVKPYAENQQLKNAFIDKITRDGLESNLCYYRAAIEGCQFEAELAIPKERLKLNFPVLFFGCNGDIVCRKEIIKVPEQQGLLPDLQVVELDCGHWSPFEKSDQIAAAMIDFLEQKFPRERL